MEIRLLPTDLIINRIFWIIGVDPMEQKGFLNVEEGDSKMQEKDLIG